MARGPLSQKRLKFYAASNAAAFWRKIVTQIGDEFSEEFSDRRFAGRGAHALTGD
jgi:hypothetical protein